MEINFDTFQKTKYRISQMTSAYAIPSKTNLICIYIAY